MIEPAPGPAWQDLQDRVAAVLTECGLNAEVTKTIITARVTAEIDVYAEDRSATPRLVYFCECKRWQTAVPQKEVLAFRSIMSDGGAHVGLMISARGFQAGAHQSVQHTNTHLLNWVEFEEMLVERWCKHYWVPALKYGADRLASYVEMSDAPYAAEHDTRIVEPEEIIGLFVLRMYSAERGAERMGMRLSDFLFGFRDQYARHLPEPARSTPHLRVLLDEMLLIYDAWMKRTGRT